MLPIAMTKLHAPQSGPAVVQRSRLLERLDEGLAAGRRLTLVEAPAGYGKTTLLSTWLHRAGRPFCWVSLDAGDNDLTRLASCLIAALRKVAGPDLCQATASLLQMPQPLTVARWRARADVTEIRAAELRFTGAEADEFFRRTMRVELPPEAVAALEARTEGWAAGLQLAGLSLQGRNPAAVRTFVESLSGGHRYILDYLAEEVLREQSPTDREFLCQTALLDRLSAPLCEAVTGRTDSRSVLSALEQANLFLVPPWLAAMPVTELEADPELCVYRIWGLFSSGQIAAATAYLPQVLAVVKEDAPGASGGGWSAFRPGLRASTRTRLRCPTYRRPCRL